MRRLATSHDVPNFRPIRAPQFISDTQKDRHRIDILSGPALRAAPAKKQVPNQEPETKLGCSSLNILGQPRTNWLYQEVTVIALIFFSKPLTYSPEIVVKL